MKEKFNLTNQIFYSPNTQNICVEWESYIYNVTPQKTEIKSFIFLLQRDKLPVHQLFALKTSVTK